MTELWSWLDRASIVAGLVLAIPVFWTWWEVTFGMKQRQRRWLKEVCLDTGARPSILMVDLRPGSDMRAQVTRFVEGHEALRAIPQDRRFRVFRQHELTAQDMPELSEELRLRAADIARAGCDVVHCFYSGPVTAAMLVGAEFANSCRLMLYHFNQGQYIPFGPLRYHH